MRTAKLQHAFEFTIAYPMPILVLLGKMNA